MTTVLSPPAAAPSRPRPGAEQFRAGRFAATWTAVGLLLAVAFALAHGATRPAPDRPAGRDALATARQLQDLGPHVAGSPQLAKGLDAVADELKTIPGLEVQRQRATGSYHYT